MAATAAQIGRDETHGLDLFDGVLFLAGVRPHIRIGSFRWRSFFWLWDLNESRQHASRQRPKKMQMQAPNGERTSNEFPLKKYYRGRYKKGN